MRKKLEELNLIDDFMFFKTLENEEVGEEFARRLLKIIFGREFGKLKVIPQRVYYGADTDKHGVRLDVYLEEEIDQNTLLEDAIICDIEPEVLDKEKEKDSLPRRVRFYHSQIDSVIFESGKSYKDLKKVIVVMIMPFDPFGYDQKIYTIMNKCLEVPELPYDDGAKTMFLYTRGRKGTISQGLQELLKYMEETTEENVTNGDLKEIHNMVIRVKQNVGVSKEYMKWAEIQEMWKENGLAEGILIGVIKTARKYGATSDEIIIELMRDYDLEEEKARQLCVEY